jgi:hypothetical protein
MSIDLTASAASELRGVLDCPIILEGERGYHLARRVWNADIDRYPAAIIQCRGAEDVSRALVACLDRDLEVTVRGGGHNVAGTAVINGAVMIDLSLMRDVVFDTSTGLVAVGGGANWGDVDRPCGDLGVAVPAGVVSHTGVAGLTLGGGAGYLGRQYGATVDHLVEVEFVVADGRVLTVSAGSHPDLFWALKGAGHNFGVATTLTFRHVPVPWPATVNQAIFGGDDRRVISEAFADLSPRFPDETSTFLRLLVAPPYWSQIPTLHRGQPIISVATVHYGTPQDAARISAPLLRAVRQPIWTTSYTLPHMELQHRCDDEFRYGVRHYWKHLFMNSFDGDAIATALEWADRYPGRSLQAHASIAPQLLCPFEILAGGGELARRESGHASMPERTEPFGATIAGDWIEQEEGPELVAWAQGFAQALAPHQQGSYVNFTSIQGDSDTARFIYGKNYERLVATKKAYDPGNAFRRGLADLTAP